MLGRYVVSDNIDLGRLAIDLAAYQTHCVAAVLLDDAASLDQPEPQFIVPRRGIVDRGLVFVGGESSIGKTFLAIDLGLSIAARRNWLGAAIAKPGPVIYIAAEGDTPPASADSVGAVGPCDAMSVCADPRPTWTRAGRRSFAPVASGVRVAKASSPDWRSE